jgi:hypothetical protein
LLSFTHLYGFGTGWEAIVRTFGNRHLRTAGATAFLGLLGTSAALLPIAIFAVFNQGEPAHWTLYAGASVVGGAVIGWVLRR